LWRWQAGNACAPWITQCRESPREATQGAAAPKNPATDRGAAAIRSLFCGRARETAMGILEFLFGKPKGTNGDDVLEGDSRNNVINGRKGNDQISGNDGNDWLIGGKGDDILQGGKGNDVLRGNSGNDVLLGGAGNDTLYGDDKGHGHFSRWWGHKPPGYADYLDGQSGSDKVYGGSGNDFANYTMAENRGAHDLYDGGKGNDTLQITLTWAESLLTSVQQDLARFEVFLSRPGNAGKTFEFKAFDLDVRNFEDVVVKVLNAPPTARDDDGSTGENQKLVVSLPASLLNNDTDPDAGDSIVANPIVDGSSTLGAVVNVNADGSYSYDPTAAVALQALKAGQNAVDTFQYTIRDQAGHTSTATVSITVLGANDAPVAQDDAYGLDEDNALTVGGPGVLGNDSDVEQDALAAVLFEGPAHGMVALNADGSFTYTPEANYNGTDSFQYRTTDGSAPSGIATVTLTIHPVADAPEARDDAYAVDEDGTLTLDAASGVLANDTDADQDPIQAILVNAPAHGSLALNADGSLTYTPAADYNGADSFQYRVNDGTLDSGIATVNITVNPVNDAPVAVDDNTSTDEDHAIGGSVLGNDTDADHDTLTVGNPGTFLSLLGATVTLNADGTYAYDPRTASGLQALNNGQVATDSFGYTIADGNGGTSSATVSIDVSGVTEAAPQGNRILPSIAPETDLDYVIRFENGEWMNLRGFQFGLENSGSIGSIGSGGGAGAGKSSSNGVTLDLDSGGQLTALTQSLLSGEHLKNVEIEAYRATGSGKAMLVDEFKFNDVLFTRLDGGNGAGDNTLGFDFASFTHGHIEQNKSGGIGDITTAGWDFKTNQEISGPSPVANGTKVQDLDQVAPDSLEYYVRFDGAEGWLQVSGFSFGFENTSTVGSSGGAGAGKAGKEDVGLTLGSSGELLALTLALASGEHIKNVEIEAYRASIVGKEQLVDEFHFNDVIITRLDTVNGTTNELAFDFGAFTHAHIEQTQSGGSGSITDSGWDFKTNTPEPVPAPQAEALGDLADGLPAGMDLDYVIRFENGEWMNLRGFQFGLENSGSIGSIGSGGGAGAGKSSSNGVTLDLDSGGQLTALTQSLLSGEHLKNVEIEAYRATGSGKAMLVDEFKFNDVLFTRLDGGNGAGDNTLGFDFASFTHGHIEQNKSGGIGDITTAGWDFKTNQEISGPSPVANGTKVQDLDQVAPDSLEYYVRFDGAEGWLQVSGFSFGFENTSTVGSSGGAGAGKAGKEDVGLTLGSSGELLALTLALASGEHIKNVEIEAYRASIVGKEQLVDEFHFNDVIITRLDTVNGTTNELAFDFGAFTHAHIEQTQSGGSGSITDSGWDFKTNTPEPVPAPHADVLFG
jgi:VCBS repeat-containing protein